MFPTLPTLLRVALVFSVGLEFFFAGSRDKPLVAVVRKKDRVALPERPGTGDVAYRFESLDFTATERRFNAYLAEFFPVADDAMRPHHHPGVEFIHTLHGTLGVHINGDVHRAGGGRLDLLRRQRAPRLSARERPDVHGPGGDGGVKRPRVSAAANQRRATCGA